MNRNALAAALLAPLLLWSVDVCAQPADSLVTVARTAFAEGRYEDVIERLTRHAAPDAPAEALYLLGRSRQALLQHEAALDALRAAHARDTTSARILQALGHSHEALGRLLEAEAAYARALELAPSRVLHLRLADLYRRMRAWKEAAHHYGVLLRSDSANGLLHARMAQVLEARHQPERALHHYRRAHRLNPRPPTVALRLSRLLDARDDTRSALRVIDSTLAHHASPALWQRRAELAFKQDSLDAAGAAYENAVQLGDSSASTFRRLGIVRIGLGRHAAALDALRRARARDSTNARTHFYLGVAYREVDSLHQSARAFERAIDLVADDVLGDAYLQAAVTYDALDDLPAALDAYKTALRVQPGRVEVYFHLATLYDRYYRDKTTAALYYRKFLAATGSLRTPLHAYATRRLEALRPTLHFQQGRGQ